MKTINFKSVLPLLLIIAAITSAFAFQNHGSIKVAAVDGWIDSPAPCEIQFSCDNLGGQVCRVMYQNTLHDVYGKVNPTDATCAVPLTRSLP